MKALGTLLILLGALSGCEGCEGKPGRPPTTAATAAADPKHLPLAPKDDVRLAQQRKIIRGALRAHYGENLVGGPADLPFLQKLIDEDVFSSEELYERESIAVAFGDVLASELPLRWVMALDEHGSDPALCCRPSGSAIDVLSMITVPLERGDDVDLAALAQSIREEIKRLDPGDPGVEGSSKTDAQGQGGG